MRFFELGIRVKEAQQFSLAETVEYLGPHEGWGRNNNNRVYPDVLRDSRGKQIGTVPTMPLGVQLGEDVRGSVSNTLVRAGVRPRDVTPMFKGDMEIPRSAAAAVAQERLNSTYVPRAQRVFARAWPALTDAERKALTAHVVYPGYKAPKATGMLNEQRWSEAAAELNRNKLDAGLKKRVAGVSDILRRKGAGPWQGQGLWKIQPSIP